MVITGLLKYFLKKSIGSLGVVIKIIDFMVGCGGSFVWFDWLRVGK